MFTGLSSPTAEVDGETDLDRRLLLFTGDKGQKQDKKSNKQWSKRDLFHPNRTRIVKGAVEQKKTNKRVDNEP